MDTRLKEGLAHFRNKSFKKYKNLFKELKDQQHPHTLFIACSDSRVSPELLTGSNPGDVFVIRNIANTVPVYDESDKDLTTASAIEFAVEVLEVEQIIICGHSNCGGCATVLNGTENISHLPYLKEYLQPLKTVQSQVEKHHQEADRALKAEQMEKMNVVEQLKHIKEYPSIQNRLKKKEIIVEGWHYDIGAGDVQVYNEKEKKFRSIIEEVESTE